MLHKWPLPLLYLCLGCSERQKGLAQMVKLLVLRLCPLLAPTSRSAGSCPSLIQFRPALSALPIVRFYSWQNKNGVRVVSLAWKEWMASTGWGPWSQRPHFSVWGAESWAVVVGSATPLGLAWHLGRIRRLWSEQDTRELQPMLISDLEDTQRREKHEDSLWN